MNLDLLKKLIKLANNNPNEHEANSAARRVCKMIEENNFNFNETKSSQNVEPSLRGVPYSYDPIIEFFKNYKRQDYGNYANGKWSVDYEVKEEERRKQQEQDEHDRVHYAYDYMKDGRYFYKKKKEKRESRVLKCKICGNYVSTKFVGEPLVFECNSCQWTAYLRDKKDATNT